MRYSSSIVSLAVVLCMTIASAHAFDEVEVPGLDGSMEIGPSRQMGSDQTAWSWTASTFDSRVSGDFRG